MADIITVQDFYKQASLLIPERIQKEIGHFNVFKTEEVFESGSTKMPYNRRAYYKISLIIGKNRAEYADKVIDIEDNALLFATPQIPYNYHSLDEKQSGIFCIFSEDFFAQGNIGKPVSEFPVFQPGGNPIFFLNPEQIEEVKAIFGKMLRELDSDYAYKYDLIRNYVMELIHTGQKLQPVSGLHVETNAFRRVSSLFMELLERQFPVEPPHQKLKLRSAKDYADRLSIHVNYLNKVLKEMTGKTTTGLILERIVQEAKILLKHTDWNISEIAYCLGFDEPSHFNNLFKKHTSLTPKTFRA
ncbi:helix-turn-helix domain-containing protein [Dyadobacter diqingensis]|uniref:helix-turn-helix domain-containing protein n=1 Tax=Dyadobacter diqingensis TaxID=2938121 RepID=UPI0020C1AE54|nr:AraC family transcriptional regulator [Dyadobacter diqingensis]